ncbi:DNA-directed DNA polymerase, family A domain protein [Candidatus Magnetoovum chiemensis]|nr:DNA-directed DNA polymerase, family A domain protein [Candidatus Magnetoovum chiemensis]
MVRSPLGRIRRFPNISNSSISAQNKAIRKAINMPVQSFCSDLGLISMVLMQREIKKRYLDEQIKLMWFIHDSIIFQAKEPAMDTAMAMLKDCMEKKSTDYIRSSFGIDVSYPIKTDGKIGPNWAEMKKFID